MKQKLTIVGKNITSLSNNWFSPLMEQYFDFRVFDPEKTYDLSTCLFYIDWASAIEYRSGNSSPSNFYRHCIHKGYKVLFDNLWEMSIGDDRDRTHTLHNKNWFWYNEALWYKNLGYQNYVPIKTYKKLALMPMRIRKPHRDAILAEMSRWLDDFYWSYIDCGRQLPQDLDAETTVQRYINTVWFDDTHISIVPETSVHPTDLQDVFITEKTFKAIAFYHPFLIWGHAGSLAYLRSQGFETFENLFDEKYDEILIPTARLKAIGQCVADYETQPYDKLTLEKLTHNHDLFYNEDIIIQRMKQEVVEPILEFAAK